MWELSVIHFLPPDIAFGAAVYPEIPVFPYWEHFFIGYRKEFSHEFKIHTADR